MEYLEVNSYRYLQKLAKAMKLPANVKKACLVQMIKAKKSGRKSEVQQIIHQMKKERRLLVQAKKRNKQIDSSSSGSGYPATSDTSKRPASMLRCSELRHQMMRSPNTPASNTTTRPGASDRVLRSCNVKFNQSRNKFVEVNPRHVHTVDTAPHVNLVRVIQKHKPNILSASRKETQMVPVTHAGPTQTPVKRQKTQRVLSGIYPIAEEPVPVGGGVGVQNSEGKMAALDASIYKPQDDNYTSTSARSTDSLERIIELTLQDVIDGNVEQAGSLSDPNTNGNKNTVVDVRDFTHTEVQNTSSVYYHNKIRAEQVREPCTLNTRCELPPIDEAFDQFRGLHDVTQPLYVPGGDDFEGLLDYPMLDNEPSLLETLYNFKSQLLTHQPLPQMATTTNTICVYSTSTVATAALYQPTSTYQEPYVAYANRSSSSISTVTSRELGANMTYDDMVDDAVKKIDADYMKYLGLAVSVRCVLCDWVGFKILLENHFRLMHPNDIDQQKERAWNITYSLGSVHPQLWKSRVIQHESDLYVLSVKYAPPGCFRATLSTLTTDPKLTSGSITVFNRVTGEPHTWFGPIQELSPSLAYDTQPGLQLDLASLDLLPNSANLNLVDGEVLFGQCELNDVHIILFIKIF